MNSVIWYKVWADLWGNKVRTTLTVLSIAAGVFAIGTIFGMVDQLARGMDEAHQSTTPSHISMYIEPIDRTMARRLKNIEGIDDIELSSSGTARYKTDPSAEWQSALIVMRDDYNNQKYDTWQLKDGPWPDKRKFGIERLSSQFFDIEIGEKVIFEVGNSERTFDIVSLVRHPFVQPPAFGGQAVFFTDAAGLERFGMNPDTFGQLLIRVKPYSPELAREVASEIKDRLNKEDINVAITFYQDPEEHWGRRFIDGMNFVLQILAVVSLLLSVVLVTNTMTALITQQIDQIGIMKAIGGTRRTIMQVYLSGVLFYGVVAFIIALPLGAFMAFGMTQAFLNIFNIDYEDFRVSNLALGYQIIAAMVVPLLAAIVPVLNGAAITVRQAIASYGLGGGRFGRSWLDRLIDRIGALFLSGPYAMALGNMFRRKPRLMLTQGVLVIAGTMYLMVMSLAASIDLTLSNDMDRRGFDIRLTFFERQRIDQVERMAMSVPGVEHAEVWFSYNAALLKQGQRVREAGVGAQINGIPADNQAFQPLMLEGRWLEPEDDRAVVISKDMADDNDLSVGEIITLNLGDLGDDEWQIVGIFTVVYNAGFDSDPIYAPRDAVFAATKKHNEGTRLIIRTDTTNPTAIARTFQDLKTIFEDREMSLNLFESNTTIQDRLNADEQFAITINLLQGVAMVVGMVGGVGLMGTLSISVVERTREIGVMRAIGARSPIIMGMFMMEGLLQGLLSWLITVPLSWVIGYPLAQQLGLVMLDMELDYAFSYEAIISWFITILVVSIFASILPARSATRISVSESLAYG